MTEVEKQILPTSREVESKNAVRKANEFLVMAKLRKKL